MLWGWQVGREWLFMVMVARRRTSGLGRLQMQTRVGSCARNLAGKSNCGPASARGAGFTGGVLLRDREGTLTNPVSWAADNAGDTREERTYACSDFRGNVSALVSAAGTLVEQFRYSALGVPIGMPLGDVNGDGKVDGADYLKTNAAVGGGTGKYLVELDVDLSGQVTSADVAAVTANHGLTLGRGKMSAASVAWRIGWRGSVGMEWVGSLRAAIIGRSVYFPELAFATSSASGGCFSNPITYPIITSPSLIIPGYLPNFSNPNEHLRVCCRSVRDDPNEWRDSFNGWVQHCEIHNQCPPSTEASTWTESPIYRDYSCDRKLDNGTSCCRATNADITSCMLRMIQRPGRYPYCILSNNCLTDVIWTIGMCCLRSTWTPSILYAGSLRPSRCVRTEKRWEPIENESDRPTRYTPIRWQQIDVCVEWITVPQWQDDAPPSPLPMGEPQLPFEPTWSPPQPVTTN